MCNQNPNDYICIPREEDIALQRVAKAAERFLMDVLDDDIDEMPDDTPGSEELSAVTWLPIDHDSAGPGESSKRIYASRIRLTLREFDRQNR